MECFYESAPIIFNNCGVESKIYILKTNLDYMSSKLKTLEKRIDRLDRQVNPILKPKH